MDSEHGRFRITLRRRVGGTVELRGLMDDLGHVGALAMALEPLKVLVIASAAADDYNPWADESDDAARLSKLLFEAREVVDMLTNVAEARTGTTYDYTRRLRDQIDEYRAERGWNPNGFGGET